MRACGMIAAMPDTKRVLVVEDDAPLRRTLERLLKREGCEVFESADGQEAIERFAAGLKVDLVITDLMMPRADGRAVVEAAVKGGVPVVVLTAHATVETAVEMMRNGAANFLMKPFSPDSLRGVLDDAFGRRRSMPSPSVRNDGTSTSVKSVAGPTMVSGEDSHFRQVIEPLLQAVAETEATVLILGESGTGKELAARMIHELSSRAQGPFVAVNCGAIPEQLIESELFGHKKGAFTDATQSRIGRFQQAERGTIFLDEIGDTPPGFQVKLLRVLQERSIEILGENQTRPVDVRVIAATNRDLKRMVDEKKFRLDLFYRLNVVDVELPPLRDRRSDIPLLVAQFLEGANERHGRCVTGLHPSVMLAFDSYPWPGNIRELANVVERMVVLKRSGGELVAGDLPPQLGTSGGVRPASASSGELPAMGIDLRQHLAGVEESLIQAALERTRGNRNAAAILLGMNRTTLVEKLRRIHDVPESNE